LNDWRQKAKQKNLIFITPSPQTTDSIFPNFIFILFCFCLLVIFISFTFVQTHCNYISFFENFFITQKESIFEISVRKENISKSHFFTSPSLIPTSSPSLIPTFSPPQHAFSSIVSTFSPVVVFSTKNLFISPTTTPTYEKVITTTMSPQFEKINENGFEITKIVKCDNVIVFFLHLFFFRI
jgi:hypothetical protein